MAKKPKVFIVGISGLLGHSLGQHLRKNFLVAGACFRNQVIIPDVQVFPITLKSMEVLEAVLRMQRPDYVISAVGMSDRKEVEEQAKLSDTINIGIPVSMAILSSRLKAKYIFIGCSEVFDGEKGNYVEEDNDFTLTDSVGKQKIAAYSFIRAQTLESTSLRLGRVLGMGHPWRPSFFDRIRVCASNKQPYEASKNKSRSYISTHSFVRAMELVLQGEFPSRHRLFHLGGANTTEHAMVSDWYKLMNRDPKLVQVLEGDFKRDLTLNCGLFEKSFPAWKAESKGQLFSNLIEDMSPAVGVKKWQKTLQTL